MTADPDRRPRPAVTDVVVEGPLTVGTSRALHALLRRTVEGGARHLRVDLHGVDDADPAGVAVLLVYSRLLPPLGGRLEIVRASDTVRDVVASVHLARVLVSGDSSPEQTRASAEPDADGTGRPGVAARSVRQHGVSVLA